MSNPLRIEKIIEIDRFALKADFIFPQADLAVLAPHKAELGGAHVDFAAQEILLGVQSLLLRHGSKVILVDTCVGGCKDRPRRPEWHQLAPQIYLGQLAAAGLAPEDVDIVFCTHLHADHVGWNTRLENGAWVPTFPNARYIVSKLELEHWLAQEAVSPAAANHGAFVDSVAPIIEAGLMDPVDEGFSLGKGLDLVALPGHSPGQMGLMLRRQDAADICLCGDAFHSPAQAIAPQWCSRFCDDPAQAVATRMQLIDAARHDGLIIVPSHIRRDLGFGLTGGGLRLLSSF